MSKLKPQRMIAKTLFGLEEVLAEELTQLGAAHVETMNRSVSFDGDKAILYRANMCCRTATRVLLPIARFHAGDEKQLYRNVMAIDWSRHLDPSMTLAIDALVSHSRLTNGLFVAQLAKDAIVDQLREAVGDRPAVDTKNPDLRINLYIHEDRASLALDASNEPLNRRGYRTEGGKAPLSEVLAAGILQLTGYTGEGPLVDPMCGSGTFLIEAACIARDIAPAVIRSAFGFMRWKDFDRKLFGSIHEELAKRVKDRAPHPIVGSDIDRKQIQQAQANARRADVDRDIQLAVKPMDDCEPPATPGIMVTNPPYGERLQPEEIEALYKQIGDVMKQKFEGYNAYVLTGNLTAAKRIGLRTSRRTVLYNGPIEARLLKFEMYRGTREKRD